MDVGFNVTAGHDGAEIRQYGGHRHRPSALIDIHHSAAGDAAVIMGRLYYREALQNDLALVPDAPGDAALVLAAYRRRGPAGLERLEGDFALALWDNREKRLIGCRDPLGGYPLFWVALRDEFVLGTGLSPLMALLPQRKPSLDYLADFLMIPGPVNERHSELCAYEGLHRVAAGSWIALRAADRHVERHAYWDWRERLIDPGTDRFEDIGEGYVALLRGAVGQRINGRTVAHLSGGMDSTAVALLAHAAIAAGAGEPPLHTLSLTYQALPALARETPFLEAALGALAGVEAHRLPADALLDFDSFIDPPVHDEPYVGLWRLGMDRAMTRAAAGIGASTVLTGIGADELLDLQPFHITDLLRHGYLCEAWAEAARWARYDNCSRWGILYPFGIANVIPGWTERGLGRFLPVPGRSRHVMQGDWTVSPWIRPDFARKYDLRARAAAHARSTYGLISSAALSFAVDSIKSRTGDVTRWCVAAPLGLTVTHPFLDTRLLRYGLGMQARLRPEPGRLKPVLGEGMRGLLPEAIRYRARKGTFNEVYYLGLSRNLPYLLAMIDRAPIDDLDIVDKAILSRSLREAALGGAHVRQLHRLNLTLSLVRWLLMQEKRHQAITAFPARCERRQG